MSLTNTAIAAAKPKLDKKTGTSKPVKLSDGDGLMLYVTTKNKIWRARYFWQGKEQNLTLGHYPLMTLKEAREANFKLRKQLDRGENPSAQRKEIKQIQLEQYTEERRIATGGDHPDSLKVVAEDYLAEFKKNWKPRTWSAEAKRIRLHIIKPLGNLQIKEVKALEHVRPLFQALEDKGQYSTLKKVAEKFICIFNFAVAMGKCEHNPAYSIWHGLNFKRPDKNNSFPSVTDPEKIGNLLLYIDQYAHESLTKANTRRSVIVCLAAQLMPYVFLRPSHMMEGTWDEINWEAKQWNIPGSRMKNGKDFIVPLSRQALEILKQIQGYTGTNKYIFHSKVAKAGHITIEAVNKVF